MAENDSHAVLTEIRDNLKEAGERHAQFVAAVDQRNIENQKRVEEIVHSYRRMVMYFAYGVAAIIALGVLGVFLYVL